MLLFNQFLAFFVGICVGGVLAGIFTNRDIDK